MLKNKQLDAFTRNALVLIKSTRGNTKRMETMDTTNDNIPGTSTANNVFVAKTFSHDLEQEEAPHHPRGWYFLTIFLNLNNCS